MLNYGCINRPIRFKLPRYRYRSALACKTSMKMEKKSAELQFESKITVRSSCSVTIPSCLIQGGKRETSMTHGRSARAWPLLNPSKSLICSLILDFIDTGRVFAISNAVLHSSRSELVLFYLVTLEGFPQDLLNRLNKIWLRLQSFLKKKKDSLSCASSCVHFCACLASHSHVLTASYSHHKVTVQLWHVSCCLLFGKLWIFSSFLLLCNLHQISNIWLFFMFMSDICSNKMSPTQIHLEMSASDPSWQVISHCFLVVLNLDHICPTESLFRPTFLPVSSCSLFLQLQHLVLVEQHVPLCYW